MPVLSQLFGAARRGPLRPLSCSIPHDETDTGPCSRQHCCRHSLSPVQSRIRASYHSPNGSALRANPCPEVTDPVCRLPLPTLFDRPEAVHLGCLYLTSVYLCLLDHILPVTDCVLRWIRNLNTTITYLLSMLSDTYSLHPSSVGFLIKNLLHLVLFNNLKVCVWILWVIKKKEL